MLYDMCDDNMVWLWLLVGSDFEKYVFISLVYDGKNYDGLFFAFLCFST